MRRRLPEGSDILRRPELHLHGCSWFSGDGERLGDAAVQRQRGGGDEAGIVSPANLSATARPIMLAAPLITQTFPVSIDTGPSHPLGSLDINRGPGIRGWFE